MKNPITFSLILPEDLDEWLKQDAIKQEPGRKKNAHIRLILFRYQQYQQSVESKPKEVEMF